jgi:GDP-L-fucose synthase
MEKSSKIFVAGHTGLVGSAILRRLQEHGYSNLIIKPHSGLDLRRQADVEKLFASEKPEYIFLAAARVGGILANSTYKAEFIYDNLAIAMNVIHAAHAHGVKKLLNLGSSCIYPKLAPQPLKEEYLLDGPLEPTNEPYAVAKIAAIKLCRYFNEQYGTNFISVMPTNLFGQNDNFNLETSHVLPALIRKIFLARLLSEGKIETIRRDLRRFQLGFSLGDRLWEHNEKEITAALARLGVTASQVLLWGTGTPFREFLHVDDLASAAVYLMERSSYREIGEFINIGSGDDMRIADIVILIKNTVGFRGEVIYDPSKPDGTPRKLLDITRLKALGWSPGISLKEGISRTFEWYSAQSE